jgi:cobalt-zinc-cadmium efflux system outer membrane protein
VVSQWSALAGYKQAMSLRPFIFTAILAAGLPSHAQLAALQSSSDRPAIAQAVSLAQILEAAGANLDVSLARRALAAAQGDVVAADHAPAPVLSAKTASIDLQNGIGGGNVLTQKRIDKAIGLDWTWERGNKRALRTASAQNTANAARSDINDMRVQQQLAAAGAYFDLLAAQERIEQISALARSADQLASTAARRVQAGDLAAQDAARTDIEAQRAQADLLSAQLDRQRASLALGLVTGNTTAPTLTALPDWPMLPSASQGSDTESLPPVEARAEVKAAALRLDAARAAVELAAAQKKADVTLGTSFDHYPGTSTRLVELRLQMPLYGVLGGYSFQGEIARAQALQNQAEDTLEKVRRAALADLQRLQQEKQGFAARALRYQTVIVPRAHQVADMAELAYRKGAMSLTDLIDARRTLRITLLEAVAARTDHAKAASAWQLRNLPLDAADGNQGKAAF